jgi:hypothetical protein
MIYELKIKLTEKMLGDTRHQTVRRFNRPPSLKGDILLDIRYWNWAIKEACTALHLDGLDPDSVRIDPALRPPTLRLFVRSWWKENKRTGARTRQKDQFEMIDVGTVLTFNLLVPSDPEPGTKARGRAPTAEELGQIFAVIGDILGISPWGSRFGYGRFKVVSIEKK